MHTKDFIAYSVKVNLSKDKQSTNKSKICQDIVSFVYQINSNDKFAVSKKSSVSYN